MTASNYNNNLGYFCFRFKSSILKQLLILDHNALDKREKIFCIITYLETKSFKTVPKLMQPINISCLNIYGTHVMANNSTDNNVVFFFILD